LLTPAVQGALYLQVVSSKTQQTMKTKITNSSLTLILAPARRFMRQRTFAIGLGSLALAVSASALAQTSADTAGKKAPAVQTAESQAAMTPASALEKLKKGNARFVEKNMRSRDWLAKVSATAGGQYPFAVILACMDSRAPIEII